MRTIPGIRAYFLLTAFAVSLTGCGGDYNAERSFWRLSRKHAAAIQAPAAASPESFREASAALKTLVEKYPRWSKAAEMKYYLASMYFSRNDIKAAGREFSELIMSFPERRDMCARAQFTIGIIAERQGDEKRALKEYELVTERYSGTRLALQMPSEIANYYKRHGRDEEAGLAYGRAVRRYRKLVETNPYGPVVPLVNAMIARAYVGWDKPHEALKYLESFAAGYANSEGAPAALCEAARIYRDVLRDPATSIDFYKKVMDDYPKSRITGSLNVPFSLAVSYEKAGRRDEADSAFAGAIEHFKSITSANAYGPAADEARDLMATAYLLQDKYAEAVKALSDLRGNTSSDERSAMALFKSAVIYDEKLGDKPRAAKLYEEFAAAYPFHRLSEVARARIKKLNTRSAAHVRSTDPGAP